MLLSQVQTPAIPVSWSNNVLKTKKKAPLTFSSNLEYLSLSDKNISLGGIFILASFAAWNTHVGSLLRAHRRTPRQPPSSGSDRKMEATPSQVRGVKDGKRRFSVGQRGEGHTAGSGRQAPSCSRGIPGAPREHGDGGGGSWAPRDTDGRVGVKVPSCREPPR